MEGRTTGLLAVSMVIIISCLGFAGDDDVIYINFQETGNPKPLRTEIVHLEDTGERYGDRGNGQTYGWSNDRTGDARRRYRTNDCRLDGSVRLRSSHWEIAVDNGNYLVNIALGDPRYDFNNSFMLEGVNYNDSDGKDAFDIHQNISVVVNDGRLTVKNNSGDPAICYIEIADAAIGFPKQETFPSTDPTQLAFPTAEGAARNLTGGRYGDVYHVTNLNWSRPGSLAWGFASTYENHPRTIVFDVSGHIGCSHLDSVPGDPSGCDGADGDMNFNGNNITVAGQTAPGKGVTIRDHPVKIYNSSNMIMRYLRIRLGDENKGPEAAPDCLTSEDNDGLILDHISMSWSIDGIWDSRRCGKMSVQWCIFAEPLNESLHHKGSHGYLMSFRNLNADVSIHHNLFSSGSTRHPTLGSNDELDYNYLSDFRNNINYNWGGGNMKVGSTNHNIINNFFRFGPNGFGGGKMITVQHNLPAPNGYLIGNVWNSIDPRDVSDCADFTADNYEACDYKYAEGATRKEWEALSEFSAGDQTPYTESALDAYESVLAHAGCSLVRDTVDERIINNVVNSKGALIDSQNDVGGWDDYASESRPAGFDTDRDGMPDAWEKSNKLDPKDPSDRNGDRNGDGYTNLKAYLNQLAAIKTDRP